MGKKWKRRMKEKLAWAAVLALYGSCWLLPIFQDGVGYDGAALAHTQFWRLITEGQAIYGVGDVFAVIFQAIGWLANELFVLGLAICRRWPRAAVRGFAFSLGIMLSWQAVIPEEFPFLIGYWFWVAAGALALGLAAHRLARTTRRGLGATLAEPVTLALLLAPVVNAALAMVTNSGS